MPGTVSYAQNDTFQLNSTVVSTFVTGDCCKLTSPDNLIEVDVGKNLAGLIANNAKGLIANVEMRILMGATDDQYINGLLGQQMGGQLTPMTAVFNKQFVDGQGNIISVVYNLFGGAIMKAPEEMISASGNIEQLAAVWKLAFTNWTRDITS